MTAHDLALLLLVAFGTLFAGGCRDRTDVPPSTEEGPRIVVLSPALGVLLQDLGMEESVVGRHAWDVSLDASIPVCGEQGAINYEALLRARPTHVLTEWGARELPVKLREMAAAHAWTLRNFQVLTLADIGSAATQLEAMFDGAAPAARLESLLALIEGDPPPSLWDGRVLLLMDTAPIAALGPGSAHHELLVRVGGTPALTDGAPYMRLHAEDVVRIAPDAILLISPGAKGSDAQQSLEERMSPLAGLDIPAVVSGRVVLIDHPLGLLPSSALGEVGSEMRAAVAAWSSGGPAEPDPG